MLPPPDSQIYFVCVRVSVSLAPSSSHRPSVCLCYGFVVAFCNFANDKVIHSRLRGSLPGRVSGRVQKATDRSRSRSRGRAGATRGCQQRWRCNGSSGQTVTAAQKMNETWVDAATVGWHFRCSSSSSSNSTRNGLKGQGGTSRVGSKQLQEPKHRT